MWFSQCIKSETACLSVVKEQQQLWPVFGIQTKPASGAKTGAGGCLHTALKSSLIFSDFLLNVLSFLLILKVTMSTRA